MQIRAALADGERELATIYGRGAEARMLLAYALGVSQSYLLAHGEDEVAAASLATYHTYLSRAQKHEPLPYILGTAPFFNLTLKVTPAALIPRPETEQLVEQVVRWAKKQAQPDLVGVDIGTGTGCIVIALAQKLPQAHLSAVDISPMALALAQENARLYHVDGRSAFFTGHLLEPITRPFDFIVANLPYVRDDEWTLLDDRVKSYEPTLALRGGADGLALIRELLSQATAKLAPLGAIFLEIGWQQGAAATALARQFFPQAIVQCLQDYAGKDRFIFIQT